RGSDASYQELEPAAFPDVESVRAESIELVGATERFLAGLTEADLERDYARERPDGRVYVYKLWQMLLHVANHGTQHRSEVAAMLTGFGRSPGNLDLLGFFWTPGALPRPRSQATNSAR